jgi:hypothetical protein
MVGIKQYIASEQASGRSLRDIGRELGLSYQMCHYLLRGERCLSLRRIAEVCGACEHVGVQESVKEMLAQQATGAQQ